MKNLIILRHGDAENYGCYIFKAVDPFLSLGSLSADIEQSDVGLRETGRKVKVLIVIESINEVKCPLITHLKLRFLNEK